MIKIKRTELLKKLKILSKMPRVNELKAQVGSQIFFKAEKERIKMMVYDGEEVYSSMDIIGKQKDLENEILFNLDFKLFLAIAKKVESDLEIEVKEKYIIIKSGRTRYELYRNRLEEIWLNQDIPNIEGDSVESVMSASMFKSIIEQVYVSINEDSKKQILNAIKLKIKNSELTLCTTDGYRASICKMKMEVEEVKNIECLIPKRSIPILIEVLGLGEEVKIEISSKAILLKIQDNSIIIRCRTCEGYPDINKLLNGEGNKKININKKEFGDAIGRIGALGSSLIKLRNEDMVDKIKLIGEDDLYSEYKVSAEIEVSVGNENKEVIDMIFRNKFLADGIKSMNSEVLDIRFKGPKEFITIRKTDDEDAVYIVLPCRIV